MMITMGLFLRASHFPLDHTTILSPSLSLDFRLCASPFSSPLFPFFSFSLSPSLSVFHSLSKSNARINSHSEPLFRCCGIKVSSPRDGFYWRRICRAIESEGKSGATGRWDWPRELITRPICTKSRHVIAWQGLLLTLGAL